MRLRILWTLILVTLNIGNTSAQDVKIIYNNVVKGAGTEWKASFIFKPYSQVSEMLEIGKSTITLSDVKGLKPTINIEVDNHTEPSLYLKRKYIGEDTICLDYIQKQDTCYFAPNSPFFFSDIYFDGEDELLINLYKGGAKSSNHYECYELDPLIPMSYEPFCWGLEDEFIEFYPESNEIRYLVEIDGVFSYTVNVYKLRNGISKLTAIEKGIMQENGGWTITKELMH